MDSCEDNVIIAWGFYLLSEDGKLVKKCWIHNMFRATEEL